MYDCVIVGGGIHGTYLSQRLLEGTGLARDDLLIVDPHERLLTSFRRKAQACGMTELRSTFVHHVGTEPFGLETYAESKDRTEELRPTPGYPRRPTLSLFLDYADYVIDRDDLASLHRRGSVTSIRRADGDGLVLETTPPGGEQSATGSDTETVQTRSCVLAIGHGGRSRVPPWASGTDGITHVWDGFDPETRVDETVVVGGGVTAAQLATQLADRERVTLCVRDDLEAATTEADPRWINWNHVERHLHRHPPGSRRRAEIVRAARNDGTVPQRVLESLEATAATESLSIRRGEIASARARDGHLRLLLADGGCLTADRAVLATGFAPVFDHPFVDRLADELGLERGYRGVPVLDDETLVWRRTDGNPSSLFVTGALAAGTVGPLAGNVAGARRAADRITRTVDARDAALCA